MLAGAVVQSYLDMARAERQAEVACAAIDPRRLAPAGPGPSAVLLAALVVIVWFTRRPAGSGAAHAAAD